MYLSCLCLYVYKNLKKRSTLRTLPFYLSHKSSALVMLHSRAAIQNPGQEYSYEENKLFIIHALKY